MLSIRIALRKNKKELKKKMKNKTDKIKHQENKTKIYETLTIVKEKNHFFFFNYIKLFC